MKINEIVTGIECVEIEDIDISEIECSIIQLLEKFGVKATCVVYIHEENQGVDLITYKKQYSKDDFLNALSHDWQKNSAIAAKMGCTRDHVTKTLLKMEEVENRWVKGGKQGTREWRLKNESQ